MEFSEEVDVTLTTAPVSSHSYLNDNKKQVAGNNSRYKLREDTNYIGGRMPNVWKNLTTDT
jgi:hypothetical protein